MHTHIPSRCASRLRSIASATAVVLALAIGTPAASAKDDPPITIQGSVDVQGAVEVLNDSLDALFMQSVTSDTSSVPRVTFNIPDGKRRIVETIAFRANSATSDLLRVFMEVRASGTMHTIYLPIHLTLPEGLNTVTTSLLPVKLRIDAEPDKDDEIAIQRGFGATGFVSATICGYLVDL